MSSTQLQQKLTTGEELFASLERETLACLKNLESMPAKEIDCFVVKRQEIIAAIQKFDTLINHDPDRMIWSGEKCALEKFRQLQAALLRRVIEANGLLLAIAERGVILLKDRLAGISQGRRALQSYRLEVGTAPSSLNRRV